MSAHTPGPWEIADQNVSNALDIVAEETCVASINSDEDIPEGDCEERANARLIAAAPDLLEACKRIAADGFGTAIGDLEFLRAAIAKAEGRS